MPNTITFTEYDDAISLEEINQFFTDVATVINGKLDRDSGAASAALDLGAFPIINIPYAVGDDEPVPLKQFQELTSG